MPVSVWCQTFPMGLFSSVAYTPVWLILQCIKYQGQFSTMTQMIFQIISWISRTFVQIAKPTRPRNCKFLEGQIHHSYIIHTSFIHHPYIIHASFIHHPYIQLSSSILHHASPIYNTCYSCTLTSVVHVLCRYMSQKLTHHWLSLEK